MAAHRSVALSLRQCRTIEAGADGGVDTSTRQRSAESWPGWSVIVPAGKGKARGFAPDLIKLVWRYSDDSP